MDTPVLETPPVTQDQKVEAVIYSTTDYGLFKSIASNREVKEAHVQSLMEAIKKKNLLHLNPLVVTSDFEVIDGQHRLEAASRLGVPVYYISDEHVTKNDIGALNSKSKKWTATDYLNYWHSEGVPEFKVMARFLNTYSNMSLVNAIHLLDKDGGRNLEAFRDGKVNVDNYDNACRVAEIVQAYAKYIDFAYSTGFVLAVLRIYSTGLYDHKKMETKLEYQSRSLVKCVNVKQYIELLEEIYNYKNREDNRVSFR